MAITVNKAVYNHEVSSVLVLEYSFDFKVFSSDTVKVTHISAAGVTTELSFSGGDYTITGLGLDNGGIVTLAAGLTDGTLSIERIEPYTSETQIIEGSRFPGTALRTITDRIVMMIQQVNARVDRSLQAPMTEDWTNFTFPDLDSRKNTYLKFGADGELGVDDGAIPERFSANYNYAAGVITQYSGKLFISLQDDNRNNTPPTAGEDLWWREFSTAAEGGLPNYIDNRGAYINSDTGFNVTSPNTSTPLKESGDILIQKDAADRSGTGVYWDIELDDKDLSTALQIKFDLKAGTDAANLSIKIIDVDTSVNLLDEAIAANSEYNAASGVYQYSRFLSTSSNKTLKVLLYCSSASTDAMEWQVCDVSLGSPFYYTAPSTGDLVGEIKTFPTYKDREDLLPFAFDNAKSQADYPELYAEIGDMYEAEHVAAGDSASGAGNFYPTPIPGAYNRVGIPDLTISGGTATLPTGFRNGTLFLVKSGTDKAVGTELYIRRTGAATVTYHSTEAGAIANTGAITVTGAGVLTQEGISLDDAMQRITGDADFWSIDNGAYTVKNPREAEGAFNVIEGSEGTISIALDSTNRNRTQLKFDSADSPDARTTNETRPSTYITFGYIRYRSVRSVELMAKQTNRDDVGIVYYDAEAPVSGKNRMDDLEMSATVTHNFSDYAEINKNKSWLTPFITDNSDGTFNCKVIAGAIASSYAYLRTKSLSSVILAQMQSELGYNGTVYRPAVQDISAASKTTDLDIFLNAGTSPKRDGWKIKVTWKDGDATYAHLFTSTHNLANEYVDLAVGDNSATFAWCGYGTGGLTLVKDEANSQWIVETEGCFDKGDDGAGQTWKAYTSKTMEINYITSGSYDVNIASGSLFRTSLSISGVTHVLPFKTVENYSIAVGTSVLFPSIASASNTTTGPTYYLLRGASAVSRAASQQEHTSGEWRD